MNLSFVYDSFLAKKRRLRIVKEKRPAVVTAAGAHYKITIIYDVLSLYGKQLFRQYKRFDSQSFIAYLEEIRKKFNKFIMFEDREQHKQHRSKIVEESIYGETHRSNKNRIFFC